MQKPKVAKTLIWLRYALNFILFGYFATLSMTRKLDFRFVAKSHDNRSNGCFGRLPSQILVFAVEIVEFLANFECETRLGVCEHSKFAKSPQDAPKDEF